MNKEEKVEMDKGVGKKHQWIRVCHLINKIERIFRCWPTNTLAKIE